MKVALIEECQSDTSFPYPSRRPRQPRGASPPLLCAESAGWPRTADEVRERHHGHMWSCFIERPLRPAFMVRDIKRLKIPPFAYIPLANSNDTFSYICVQCHRRPTHSARRRAALCWCTWTEQHASQADILLFYRRSCTSIPTRDLARREGRHRHCR